MIRSVETWRISRIRSGEGRGSVTSPCVFVEAPVSKLGRVVSSIQSSRTSRTFSFSSSPRRFSLTLIAAHSSKALRARLLIIVLVLFLFPLAAPARDYTAQECPVVGNRNSGIYHVPGGRHYWKMLQQNKRGDNRACFPNEAAAKAAGYRRSKT